MPSKQSMSLVILVLFFSVSTYILYEGFHHNKWKAAAQHWFDYFIADGDGHIYSRLMQSRKDGVFSKMGLLGFYQNSKKSWGKNTNMQIELFKKGIDPEQWGNWNSYYSQIGLQGIVFSLFDRMTRFSPDDAIKWIRKLTALFTSIMLSLILTWICSEVGLVAALSALVGCCLSQWLVVMGRNLWFIFGIMYLPMVAVIGFQIFVNNRMKYYYIILFLICFVTTALKCAAGYEYVSCVLIAMITPFIYYWVRDRWSFKTTFRTIFVAGLGGITGFAATICLHSWQVALAFETSIVDGFRKIFSRALLRTYDFGQLENIWDAYRKCLDMPINEVIVKYWTSSAIKFSNMFQDPYLDRCTFWELTIVFFVITVIGLIGAKYEPGMVMRRNKIFGLAASLWISLLAPLSWYILGKGHSACHLHINAVLWYLPFTIIGFAFMGMMLGFGFEILFYRLPYAFTRKWIHSSNKDTERTNR